MKLTDEAHALLQQLARALSVPPQFDGTLQLTITYRDGVAGKVTGATTETWRP